MSVGSIFGGHFGSVENEGIPGGPAGFVSQIVAGTNVTINPVGGTGAVTINAAGAGATWTIANCRIYALDGVNGNDANAGFADPASSSTADYAIACAAAGLVAKKTIAGLAAIFPRIGNGRKVEIVILGGGTVYAGTIGDVVNGVAGYANGCPWLRGTFTNSTAGSVAFAGTTADVIHSGAQLATGMNAAGYNPIAGPTTSSTIQCQKVGGAVPAFGLEPAVPLGWRIRFDAATATVALRNICRQVCQISGTDTLLTQTTLPAVPAPADVFYLEMAGWSVGALTLQGVSQVGTGSQGITFVSMLLTGGLTTGANCVVQMSLCGTTTHTHSGLGQIVTAQSVTHPVLGFLAYGGGLRVEGAASLTALRGSFSGYVSATDTTITMPATAFAWGAGCAARSLLVVGAAAAQNDSANALPIIGLQPSFGPAGVPHTFGAAGGGGLKIDGCSLVLGTMNCIGAGASPAVQLLGKNSIVIKGVLGGAAGNNDVGMDFQNAVESFVETRNGSPPTVTGLTFGDVRMSSQALAVWTNLNFEEIWDQAGNHLTRQAVNGAGYNAGMARSVYSGVVNNGAAIAGYALVAIQAASGQVRWATADTIPNAAGLVGALQAGAGNGAKCLYVGSGYKVVLFDGAGAVTPGAVAYLSDSLVVPGSATCTVPVVSLVKAKLRLGVVVDNALPFNLAIVRFTPDNYPVLADGLP